MDRHAPPMASLREELAELEQRYKTAVRNMTLELDSTIRAAMRGVVVELQSRLEALRVQIERQDERPLVEHSIEQRVSAALEQLDHLPQLVEDAGNFAALGELFARLNAQLFLRFLRVQAGKRIVNRLSGGVLTIGDAPAPIEKYSGVTSRQFVKQSALKGEGPTVKSAGPSGCSFSDDQANSLGNVNRDDRI